MIASITAQTPVYLDSVTQIQMPRWSDGRVVLAGDAAHCLTLISGQGASTAMGGAYILAEHLGKADDYRAAFTAYERRVRPSSWTSSAKPGASRRLSCPAAAWTSR